MNDDLYENVIQVQGTDTVVARIQQLVLHERLHAGYRLPPDL